MTHHDHADCRHLLGDLSDYVDGQAAPAICAEIERHLADCPDCRVVVDTLDKTVRLYRALPAAAPSPDMRVRLLRVLKLDDPA